MTDNTNIHLSRRAILGGVAAAGAYVFLASDAAQMVTGSIIDVSAGAAPPYTA